MGKNGEPNMTEEPSDYELQRLANIARNKELLAGLGLEVPAAKRKPIPRPKKIYPGSSASGDTSNRRKSARVAKTKDGIYREPRDEYDDDEYSDEEGSMSDLYSDSSEDEGRSRKRKRGQGWPRFYEGETLVGDAKGLRRRVVNGRNVQHIDPKKRMARADPKVHGSIPGIDVGHWWPSRMACSADSVHPPTVGGIYGSGATGAFSVAVSGGYEDDIDEGFRFTFTGSGGRDLKGTVKQPKNLRTAPQSSDQTLTGFNLALKTSCDTGKPVRVIRGYKASLGPGEGYRYDGLYTVLKAWQDTGLSGFKVWKFAFKRIDGQKPLDTSLGKPGGYTDEADETEEGDSNDGKPSGESGTEVMENDDVKSVPEVGIRIHVKPETTGPKAKVEGGNVEQVEEPEKKKKKLKEPEKPVARRSSERIAKGK